MEKLLTKEESYAERRKLFKNIWETAMDMDEKEADTTKPKIIKTLRLDEMNRINIGKTKKQRIKNLRHVCKRLLDYCDRQDAEDVIYEQLASKSIGNSPPKSNGPKHKKSKRRRKIRKAKSYSPAVNHSPVVLAAAASVFRDPQALGKTPYSSSPNKVKRTTIVKKAPQGDRHLLNPQTSLVGEPGDVTSSRKVKKKPSKKKIIKGQSTGKIKISR